MDQLFGDHKKLNKDDVILDVRSFGEYSEGHVPGSINIQHDKIATHKEELNKYKKIYIYCRSGKRAQMAFESLKQLGFNNVICMDDSGMEYWIQKGYEYNQV